MSVRLVVLSGPIGAGKSSVAQRLAERVASAGRPAVVVDLDDVAFMQRGCLDASEFWRRAGVAHLALVRSWFAAGTDIVVAHGPFFETTTFDELFTSAPLGSTALHARLHVSFDVAARRVTADPERPQGAQSRDLDFLRSTHDGFEALVTGLPSADLHLDTEQRSAAEIADDLAEVVLS